MVWKAKGLAFADNFGKVSRNFKRRRQVGKGTGNLNGVAGYGFQNFLRLGVKSLRQGCG
jgi:hypothetical protein